MVNESGWIMEWSISVIKERVMRYDYIIRPLSTVKPQYWGQARDISISITANCISKSSLLYHN